MSTAIRLLGRPSIAVGGEPRSIAGQKPWGLLAYLLLTPDGSTRAELAERIWPGANDPFGALRWGLLQVRRAIEPGCRIDEVDGRLRFERGEDVLIDVEELLAGRVEPADIWQHAGTLLEGMSFGDTPDLDHWLAMQRARVASAAASDLRRAALLRAVTAPDDALRLADRALAIDPYDDASHELIVSILVDRGDRAGAEQYASRATARYLAELGVEPPDTLRRPLDRRERPAIRSRPDTTAVALLGSAEARLQAGDYEGSIDAARRAAASAGASGDDVLAARALTVLAGTLIHSVRGRDREARGLLDRAYRLARSAGEHRLVADIEREQAWVAMLEADYGAAEALARRAAAHADEAGDPAGAARAAMILGACQSDRGEYRAAAETLEAATRRLADIGDRWQAFALSFLARVHLRSGDPAAARTMAARSVELARAGGWMSLLPWPMAVEAEAALAVGDAAAAATILDEAFELALEIGDPCWEAFCLRGMALVQRDGGRLEPALELLRDALARSRRLPDVYAWARAVILTDLVELDPDPDDGHLEAALSLVHGAAMTDLAARLPRTWRQTRPQTLPA